MFSRVKIASLLAVVALGALAAVALASGHGGDPAAVQRSDDQPQVRTETVRQTSHRTARAASDHHGRRGRGADDRAAAATTRTTRGGADDGPTHDVNDDRG